MYERNSEEKRHHYWWVLHRWQLPFFVEDIAIFLVPKDIPPRIGFCKKISSLTQHQRVKNINWHSPNLVLTYFIIWKFKPSVRKISRFVHPNIINWAIPARFVAMDDFAFMPPSLETSVENSRSVNSRGYAVPKVAPAPDVNQAVVPPRHLEALWPLWDWKLRIYGMLMYIIMLMQKMMINHCSLEHVRIYTWFLDTPINIWTPKNEGKGWNGTYQLYSKFRYMLYTCLSFWRLQKNLFCTGYPCMDPKKCFLFVKMRPSICWGWYT